jgi:hypothetical protein
MLPSHFSFGHSIRRQVAESSTLLPFEIKDGAQDVLVQNPPNCATTEMRTSTNHLGRIEFRNVGMRRSGGTHSILVSRQKRLHRYGDPHGPRCMRRLNAGAQGGKRFGGRRHAFGLALAGPQR